MFRRDFIGAWQRIEAVPFLRYKLVVVCGPRHRLARARDVAPPALAGERWLVGPAYGDLSRLIAERGLPPPELGAFATEAAAQAASAAGEGLMLAIATRSSTLCVAARSAASISPAPRWTACGMR